MCPGLSTVEGTKWQSPHTMALRRSLRRIFFQFVAPGPYDPVDFFLHEIRDLERHLRRQSPFKLDVVIDA